MKRRIDIVDVKVAVQRGELSASISEDGTILLKDNTSGEAVKIGHYERP